MIYLRSRWYDPASGRFQSMDAWDGDVNAPMSYNKWLYVYANPVNLVDPAGVYACAIGKCGPDITQWLMDQMQDHWAYGQQILSIRETMKFNASQHSNWWENNLFRVATQPPFSDIVTRWTFPYTSLPIGVTPVWDDIAEPMIESLGILEYALYGLAVDYANVAYSSGLPTCGTGGCDLFGGKNHKTATLCDQCIDVSDIGNMVFGLGGAARGYPFLGTFASAASYNILADWLPNKNFRDIPGLLRAVTSSDGRGAINGWLIGNNHAIYNQTSFCTWYSIGRLFGGNENVSEAMQCDTCSQTGWPESRGPSSILYVSKNDFTEKTTGQYSSKLDPPQKAESLI